MAGKGCRKRWQEKVAVEKLPVSTFKFQLSSSNCFQVSTLKLQLGVEKQNYPLAIASDFFSNVMLQMCFAYKKTMFYLLKAFWTRVNIFKLKGFEILKQV